MDIWLVVEGMFYYYLINYMVRCEVIMLVIQIVIYLLNSNVLKVDILCRKVKEIVILLL